VAGVKGGWTVKAINGQDVSGEDFGKVMDMLDDEARTASCGEVSILSPFWSCTPFCDRISCVVWLLWFSAGAARA